MSHIRFIGAGIAVNLCCRDNLSDKIVADKTSDAEQKI
jgi:hypothetical protein